MRYFHYLILLIVFIPLSTASASDTTHISAPIWQSSGSVSISHGLVRVRLDLMSAKQLGPCLGRDSESPQYLQIPQSLKNKSYVSCVSDLGITPIFLRTGVELHTGGDALSIVNPQKQISIVSTKRSVLSWDIATQNVDGHVLRATEDQRFAPSAYNNIYRMIRAKHRDGENVYSSKILWNSEEIVKGAPFYGNSEYRVWFEKLNKDQSSGSMILDIPKDSVIQEYAFQFIIDPRVTIDTFTLIDKSGQRQTLSSSRNIIKNSDIPQNVMQIEVAYHY